MQVKAVHYAKSYSAWKEVVEGTHFLRKLVRLKFVWNNLSGILRNNLNIWFCTKQQKNDRVHEMAFIFSTVNSHHLLCFRHDFKEVMMQ